MRLIDANKLGLTDFEIVMCNGDYKEALKMILNKIEETPTVDAVQVVRCKDCKYFDCWGPKGKETFDCIRFLEAPPITPEWYCADGERREDGQD